nr:ORF2 [Torque teno Leptonychotes weddellii virus 1]
MADPSTLTPCGDPDLHHPLQYRKQEALWKLHCSLEHKKFCACPNFLDHFKWPTTGGRDTENPEGQDGGPTEENSTEEDIMAVTTFGEDIPDSALLQ